MPATALMKFTQGPNTDIAGRAVLGTLSDGPVTITNGDNTDVVSWEIEVLDVPPGSAIPLGVLATGVTNTPTANFTPDVRGGCWRFLERVHGTGGTVDEDIRCFGVPDHRGHLSPPFQSDPDPLDPAEKPNELNFGGQTFGWAGDNSVFLWKFLRTYGDKSVRLITTTPFTPTAATEADVYQVQTTTIGGASVFNVPTFIRTGQVVEVQDGQNAAATNPVTVNLPGGHTFVDGSSSVVISLSGGSVRLLKIGATSWVIEEGNVVGVSSSLTSFLRIGTVAGSGATAAASQGHFRVRKDFSMFARANADGGDKKVLGLDGSNNLTVGGGGAGLRPANIDIDAETQAILRVAADGKLFVSSTQVQIASVANGLEVQGASEAARSVRLGVAPGGGAGAYASKGDVRLAKDFSIYFRANGDAGDKQFARSAGDDNLYLGDTSTAGERPGTTIIGSASAIAMRINQATPSQLQVATSAVSIGIASLAFLSSVTSPVISQDTDATGGVTADALTARAQDVSGGSSAVGGKLVLRAGDSTSGDGSGGHALVRAGRKSGTGTDGNIAFHADPAAWQSMERGVFFGDATTVPSGNPTAGVFAYAESGDWKVRGPGGTVTTLAASGQSSLKKQDRKTFQAQLAGGGAAASVLTLTPPDNSEWILHVNTFARDTGNDRAWFYNVVVIKKQAGTVTLTDNQPIGIVENAVAAFAAVAVGGTVELRGTPDAANATDFVGSVDIYERS